MAKKKVSKARLGSSIASTLGGGRSTIIPTKSNNENFAHIPVKYLEPTSNQPRRDFDSDALEELANSIKIHGIIQPITVRKISTTKYQIISGERRYRASQLAGLSEIPAYIIKLKEGEDGLSELLEKALIENVQREDLNPVEIATSLHDLKYLNPEKELTDDEIAAKIGKARSTVQGYWRVYKLINIPNSHAIKESLRAGELTMGHAKALGNLKDNKDIEKLYQKTIDEEWSVRQLEDAVKEIKEAKGTIQKKKNTKEALPDDYLKLQQKIREKTGLGKVSVKLRKNGAGQVVVPFKSNEEFNNFLDVLGITLD